MEKASYLQTWKLFEDKGLSGLHEAYLLKQIELSARCRGARSMNVECSGFDALKRGNISNAFKEILAPVISAERRIGREAQRQTVVCKQMQARYISLLVHEVAMEGNDIWRLVAIGAHYNKNSLALVESVPINMLENSKFF